MFGSEEGRAIMQIKLFGRRSTTDGVSGLEIDVNGWLKANPKITPRNVRLVSGQDQGVPHLYVMVMYESGE